MSKILPQPAVCLTCGHAEDAVLYESLNAERLPHLLDAIEAGDFERQTCAACGASFQPEHKMLFSWLPRRLWVVMLPPQTDSPLPLLEDGLLDLFAREFAHVPAPVQPLVAATRPRLVFGQAQLTEAVRVARANLPPELVECAKLEIQRRLLPSLLPYGPTALAFEGQRPDDGALTFRVLRLRDGAVVDRATLPRAALAELAEHEAAYRARYPDLFARPYVNTLRYLAA